MDNPNPTTPPPKEKVNFLKRIFNFLKRIFNIFNPFQLNLVGLLNILIIMVVYWNMSRNLRRMVMMIYVGGPKNYIKRQFKYAFVWRWEHYSAYLLAGWLIAFRLLLLFWKTTLFRNIVLFGILALGLLTFMNKESILRYGIPGYSPEAKFLDNSLDKQNLGITAGMADSKLLDVKTARL